ncbi:MAG: hypothetical protein EXR75_05805 [Myxococcales bacterium]|nr:hypothetical protein [Myxococcales bacterium]
MTRFAPAFALARRRLRASLWARIGWFFAWLPPVAVCFGVLGDAPTDLSEASALLVEGMRLSAWGGAAGVALAAAGPLAVLDREEGIDALVVFHGGNSNSLPRMRWFAAVVECALRVATPSLLACLVLAVATRSFLLLSFAPGITAFAILVGVAFGSLATACGELGRRRGRSLLVLLVLVPWLLAQSALGPRTGPAELLGRAFQELMRPLACSSTNGAAA